MHKKKKIMILKEKEKRETWEMSSARSSLFIFLQNSTGVPCKNGTFQKDKEKKEEKEQEIKKKKKAKSGIK